MKWAKGQGACGVLLRGFEGDRTPLQRDFDPIYAAARDLDLAVCIHIGHGSPAFRSIRITPDRTGDPFTIIAPTLIAFSVMMRSDLHKRFPGLRFGFIEAGSAWLPFLGTLLKKEQDVEVLQRKLRRGVG